MPKRKIPCNSDQEILQLSKTLQELFSKCPLFTDVDYKLGNNLNYEYYYEIFLKYYQKEIYEAIGGNLNLRIQYYNNIIPISSILSKMNLLIKHVGEESFTYTECTENIT